MAAQSESRKTGLDRLLKGQAPGNGELLGEITVGLDSLTDFIKTQYLQTYIPQGGSKIKCVTGRPGCGKTHFAQALLKEAEAQGFLTVSFSAKEVWLHDFRGIYLEILRQCGIERVLEKCAGQIIRELGYDPEAIGPGKNLMDYLSERRESDPLSKGAIRDALRRYFTRNPRLDNTFGGCCSLLTGGILGHPLLENASRDMILGYLNGDKAVKLAQLRALGLSPSGITKYNARHLLRSLCELVRLAGYQGLLIVIHDMETLLNRAPGEAMRYTKLRREDTYESIRQLIDDIDSMRNVMFLLCFRRDLMDDDSYGMKSYQALWMRIQNEVVANRFNRFADIIDLDRYADEMYSAEALCEMSRKLAWTLKEADRELTPLSPDQAGEIMRRAEFGSLGLPYLVNRALVEGGGSHV